MTHPMIHTHAVHNSCPISGAPPLDRDAGLE